MPYCIGQLEVVRNEKNESKIPLIGTMAIPNCMEREYISFLTVMHVFWFLQVLKFVPCFLQPKRYGKHGVVETA